MANAVTVLHCLDDASPMRQIDSLPPSPVDGGWLWIDVRDPTETDPAAAMRAIGVDPDLLGPVRPSAFPSARGTGDALVVVIRGLTSARDRVATTPLTVVVTPRGLITMGFDQLPGVAWARERAESDSAFVAGGPDLMFARLVEVGAERFLPLIQELDASIDHLEDRAIDAHPDVLAESHALRRDASVLRGVLRSQRDVLRGIIRQPAGPLGAVARAHLEDAYDIHQRIVESLDTARVMLGGVIELYRSAVAERTNEVMKVLTVFSAMLLPLGVIAGIYGMNFHRIPELSNRYGYFAVLAVMASIVTGLWFYFVRRGFIGGPKRAGKVGRGLVHLVALPVKTVTTLTKTIADQILPGDESRESEASD